MDIILFVISVWICLAVWLGRSDRRKRPGTSANNSGSQARQSREEGKLYNERYRSFSHLKPISFCLRSAFRRLYENEGGVRGGLRDSPRIGKNCRQYDMLRKDIQCERLFNSDTFDGESNTPLPPTTVRNYSLSVCISFGTTFPLSESQLYGGSLHLSRPSSHGISVHGRFQRYT